MHSTMVRCVRLSLASFPVASMNVAGSDDNQAKSELNTRAINAPACEFPYEDANCNSTWMKHYEELIVYRNQVFSQRHLDRYINIELSVWIEDQRDLYKRGQLSSQQIERLNDLGFKWTQNKHGNHFFNSPNEAKLDTNNRVANVPQGLSDNGNKWASKRCQTSDLGTRCSNTSSHQYDQEFSNWNAHYKHSQGYSYSNGYSSHPTWYHYEYSRPYTWCPYNTSDLPANNMADHNMPPVIHAPPKRKNRVHSNSHYIDKEVPPPATQLLPIHVPNNRKDPVDSNYIEHGSRKSRKKSHESTAASTQRFFVTITIDDANIEESVTGKINESDEGGGEEVHLAVSSDYANKESDTETSSESTAMMAQRPSTKSFEQESNQEIDFSCVASQTGKGIAPLLEEEEPMDKIKLAAEGLLKFGQPESTGRNESSPVIIDNEQVSDPRIDRDAMDLNSNVDDKSTEMREYGSSRNATINRQQVTGILKKWYSDNLPHPYPNAIERTEVMSATRLIERQIVRWFSTQRRRRREANKRLCGSSASGREIAGEATKPRFHQSSVGYLMKWYDADVTNPYPSKDEQNELASITGMTPKQVQGWFERERAKRKKNSGNESNEAMGLRGKLFPEVANNNESDEAMGLLSNPEAVGHLRKWYLQHEANPYPTKEEVANLASITGVTEGRILKWFKCVRKMQEITVEI